LKRALIHDRILYKLCEVRDLTAIKAAKGEISQDGEVFDLFYKTVSAIIHTHKEKPQCFAHICDRLRRNNQQHQSSAQKRFFRELKRADDDIKQITLVYVNAVSMILWENSLLIRSTVKASRVVDAPLSMLKSVQKKAFILSESVRTTAEFLSETAKAASVGEAVALG